MPRQPNWPTISIQAGVYGYDGFYLPVDRQEKESDEELAERAAQEFKESLLAELKKFKSKREEFENFKE